MRSNTEIQKHVQNAIKWAPSMHAAEIGVTLKGEIVTLSGKANNFSKNKY